MRNRSCSLPLAFVLAAATLALGGCSVNVSDSGLSEDARSYLVYADRDNPKTVFTGADKQVTLHVRFDYNVVASTQRFRTVWTEPSGQTYIAGPVGTVFGSNQDLIVSLALANTPAAKLKGLWRVQLFHVDKLLVEHEFEVR